MLKPLPKQSGADTPQFSLRHALNVPWYLWLLVCALNMCVAGLEALEDPRPFIYPLISAQATGFAIALWVSCFRPWRANRPWWPLIVAVIMGTITGMAVNVAIKIGSGLYSANHYFSGASGLMVAALFTGFHGLFVSAMFVGQLRERIHLQALHASAAEKLQLSRQAIAAELRMMQAQVEPHFLFNTLSNVQFLVETNPPAAAIMLEHLTAYLRASIPQLREQETTLGREIRLTSSYLAIIQMRMGDRMRYAFDVPEQLLNTSMPPMMLLSLVENAVKHGIEPSELGGEIMIQAKLDGRQLVIEVRDTGCGLSPTPGQGVGLMNIRERLDALYGRDACLNLRAASPGAIATLTLPTDE
ncbi:histidine kinase [Burkholderiaceae bacterium DAT-1]|nr:histidine kinase [Burkholderiaceae bacterium DAT-1]